jgi:hypothetical protein
MHGCADAVGSRFRVGRLAHYMWRGVWVPAFAGMTLVERQLPNNIVIPTQVGIQMRCRQSAA